MGRSSACGELRRRGADVEERSGGDGHAALEVVLEPGATSGQWLGMAVSLAALMLGIWLVMN